MRRNSDHKKILPSFPRTPHLPWSNTSDGDLVLENHEIEPFFQLPVNVEEKVDGASVGMTLWDGHPLIRNRDHILRKGYVKDTPAKKQFVPVWNWFYENKKKFEYICSKGPFSLYGEWMIARHGIFYDRLPDWFIAYDVYDYESGHFLSPEIARPLLHEAGFVTPRLHYQGLLKISIPDWADRKSQWSESPSEGIYFKTYDSHQVINRFKLVRDGFQRGVFWDGKNLLKNALAN